MNMSLKFQFSFISLFLFWDVLVLGSGKSYSYYEIRNQFLNLTKTQFGDGFNITIGGIKEFYVENDLILTETKRPSPVTDCLGNASGSSQSLDTCFLNTCISPGDVYAISGLSQNTTDEAVSTMSMVLLHTLGSKLCAREFQNSQQFDHNHENSPSSAEIWGYGILCTSIIVLVALVGFFALPFVHGLHYKRALLFMVGLAVGTLAGSSLLFLAPEALELTDQEMNEDNYVWKCLVMVSAIYFFFNIERVLKMLTGWRERYKRKHDHGTVTSIRFTSTPLKVTNNASNYADLENMSTNSISRDSGIYHVTESTDKNTTDDSKSNTKVTDEFNRDGANLEDKHIAPVAWMIIFGDAVHNCVDGVSIGAAFTESILAGVSVSVAVFCEELPHELGDFAVLLSGGMSKKRAVICNFLSACTIYIGMIIGIFLGENETAHTWVFAFAGGMFLYIALVDMMPEMCAIGELKENRKDIGIGCIFLLQNLGLLFGFGIILILAIYGGNLEEAIRGET